MSCTRTKKRGRLYYPGNWSKSSGPYLCSDNPGDGGVCPPGASYKSGSYSGAWASFDGRSDDGKYAKGGRGSDYPSN